MDVPAETPFPQSRALFERARKALAGGVSSQIRALSPFHPMFYDRAEGSRVWDADGNALIDYTLAQGPCILGHSHPELVRRVQDAVARGQSFAGQHRDELELAETLQRLVPCAERVRFASSGSEAAQACLRLARAVTGRQKFIKFDGHYHGWLDSVSFNTAPPARTGNEALPPIPSTGGIAESAAADVIPLPWNDLDLVRATLRERGHEVAAVVTEGVMCNQGCIEPLPGFLEGLRALCDEHGCALVLDEIITGFRLGLGGASGHYGVVPDLSLFGKALGSGFPLAAVVGRERWMAPLEDGRSSHAGTMNGNVPCVAAGLATIGVLERDGGAALRHIGRLGARLRDGLAAAGERAGLPVRVMGPGPMFHMGFAPPGRVPGRVTEYQHLLGYDRPMYLDFCRRMLVRGHRLIDRGLWYVSAAHTDADIAATLDAAAEVMAGMGDGAA